jgi:CRISPR-associated protein Csy2
LNIKKILLLPHLKIQNANALSSPYTIGFPAMTALLGAIHALQRKLNAEGFSDLIFNKVGVICHNFNLQTYKGKGDYVYSIVGTGNPLDKEGNRPAFLEEARCHLEISLIIETEGLDIDDLEKILKSIEKLLHSQLKVAGGDILSLSKPEFYKIDYYDQREIRKFISKLMPGFVLVERRDLLIEGMKAGQDALEALLDYLSVKNRSEIDEEGKVAWTSKRKTAGWLIPVATGFQGISPVPLPGEEVLNQRDPTVPHRFAEAVVTLGEFKMAYRINSMEELLWYYYYDDVHNLYLCQQEQLNTETISV